MKKVFTIIFLVILLIGCTGKAIHKIELKEAGKPIEVYFCPKEDCEKPLIELIENAKSTVHCAFYDITLPALIDVMDKRAGEIDVKLVMDSDTNKKQTKSIPLVMDDESQLSHNKFCVIDGKIITGGSFNPTPGQNTKDNNNLVIINSRLLAENYEAEFNELWSRQFGSGNKVIYPEIEYNGIRIENYFCPEDNCREQVINEILYAKSSIYIMVFAFTDENVADAILMSNVSDIKGVFDKMQAGQKYSQFKRLKEFGLDVKTENSSGLLHHKVFIIDNSTVITGSYNPTAAANSKNDENILIIHDREIAEKYIEEYKKIPT